MRRRVFFLVIILLLLFSGLTYAASKVFEMKVLKVNDQTYEYEPSNLITNSESDRVKWFVTKIAESLNAMIKWNEADKTIEVVKPNVQMITAMNVGKDNKERWVIEGPFGRVKKGQKFEKFYVFTELQNLPAGNVNVRLVVEAPGQSTYSADEFVATDVPPINNSAYWITFEVKNANFAKEGSYKILLQMKLDGDTSFVTVAQKEIISN